MPTTAPFDEYTGRYEGWFEAHEHAYASEVAALDRLRPAGGDGVEIGVGTGRFGEPLGIQTGVDPSRDMLEYAATRGISPILGVAEHLPFGADTFDVALIVTTICFVDDVDRALAEARRVLRPGGRLVIGYIDADSPIGEFYREHQDENPFYRDATFVTTDDLVDRLDAAGFHDFEFAQTLFSDPTDLTEPDRVTDGYGDGSFVGISARA